MGEFPNKETQFSNTNQPTPEEKSESQTKRWVKYRALKELARICISGDDAMSIKARESLADLLGLKPEELKGMTFEEVMDLRQIQRAFNNGRDWRHFKDVVYGIKSEISITDIPNIKTTMIIDGKEETFSLKDDDEPGEVPAK